MEEMVQIVDANNNIIKIERRSIMRKQKLPHRASYIVLENSNNQYYVELRSPIKDYYPSMLDACIGGVMQAGEDDIKLSAKRELEEELGVTTDITFLGWYKIGSDKEFVYAGLFYGTYDGKLILQESEVSDVLMLSYDEIQQRQSEFTPDSIIAISEIRRLMQLKLS